MAKFANYFAAFGFALFSSVVAFSAVASDQNQNEKEAKRVVAEFYGNDNIRTAVCDSNGNCTVVDITGDRITLKCDGEKPTCLPN